MVMEMTFKITWKTHVICFIMSLLIIAAVYNLLESAIIHTVIYDMPKVPLFPAYVLLLGYIVILSAFVTFLHELIHGAAYKIFGGKVRYGLKLIYAYTTEVSGLPLSRTKFLVVLLSPLAAISVFCLLIQFQIGAIAFVFNFAGSTGDILMSLYLLRVKKNYKIIDRIYGFEVVYMPQPHTKTDTLNLSD